MIVPQMGELLCDATRISDNVHVVLKSIRPSVHPHEAEIGTFLSSEPLASDPMNHCIPIYEVLTIPDKEDRILLVMPLLRDVYSPPCDTIGEAVDFFAQIFEVCPILIPSVSFYHAP